MYRLGDQTPRVVGSGQGSRRNHLISIPIHYTIQTILIVVVQDGCNRRSLMFHIAVAVAVAIVALLVFVDF